MSRAARVAQIADEIARYRIIDLHQHIGSWATSGGYDEPTTERATQEFDERFDLMSGYGIDLAVVHPCQQAGSDAATVARRNDETLDALEKHPARFAAALAALPLTDARDIQNEWERIKTARFSGLTLHPRFSAKPINTPLMDEICVRAEANGWPVAVHAFAESRFEAIWRLDVLARRFPRVNFVALAAFSTVDQTQQILDVAAQRKNIFFDTALMVPVATILTEFCTLIGADRLLFGTDLYMLPRPIYASPSTLFEIAATPLAPEAKERILGKNAIELLGIVPS